jgi:hypothetical protein
MPSKKPPRRPPAGAKPDPGAGPHHVADEPVAETDSPEATVRGPVTETGLSVEEQVRKEWDPKKQGGLPTS